MLKTISQDKKIEDLKEEHGNIVGVVHNLFPDNLELTQIYFEKGYIYNCLDFSIFSEKTDKLLGLIQEIGSVCSDIQAGDIQKFVKDIYEKDLSFFDNINVQNIYNCNQYPSMHIVFRGNEMDLSTEEKQSIGYRSLENAILLFLEEKCSKIYEYPDDICEGD